MSELRDQEAELAVIGGILVDNTALDECRLTERDFSSAAIGKVYEALQRSINAGDMVDLERLPDLMEKAGLEVDFRLIGSIPGDRRANLAFYVAKVADLSKRRRAIALARDLAEQARAISTPITESVEKAGAGLDALSDVQEGEVVGIGDCAHGAWNEIERRYKSGGGINGLSTGLRILDIKLGGMKPGTLIVIGGRPSSGKTCFAEQVAISMAMAERTVGFFSAEMTKEQLTLRAVSQMGFIPASAIDSGSLNETEFGDAMGTMNKILSLPLLICDTPNICLADLRARARVMRRKGAQAIMVDYLTLIRHGEARMPVYQRVGEISKSLKQLARELNIPIVALSQLTRPSQDRLPTMADLRQSGEVEEDADAILLLSPDAGDGSLVHFDLAKNRHGGTGTFDLRFMREYLSFEPIEPSRVNA